MMIMWMEEEDASKGTRLIYPKTIKSLVKIKKNKQNMSENNVILLNTRWRLPLLSLKIKTITLVNMLMRASTHNLPPKAEAEVKAKDKVKAFYFKLVPFVSS